MENGWAPGRRRQNQGVLRGFRSLPALFPGLMAEVAVLDFWQSAEFFRCLALAEGKSASGEAPTGCCQAVFTANRAAF